MTVMNIGQAASASGVSAKKTRHYARAGGCSTRRGEVTLVAATTASATRTSCASSEARATWDSRSTRYVDCPNCGAPRDQADGSGQIALVHLDALDVKLAELHAMNTALGISSKGVAAAKGLNA